MSLRKSAKSPCPAAERMIAGLFLLVTCIVPRLVAQTVTVNFQTAVSTAGSPLMFGASNEPNPSDQSTVTPMFKSSGLMFERGTLHTDQIVPSNTTISAYIAAMPNGVGSFNPGSVADPGTWNWGPMSWAIHAKAQGMTTMGNMLYVPKWLSFNSSGINIAPVNDWNHLGIVWEDIVTKIVKHALTGCNSGRCLNYLEILNEPTCGFLNVGSGDSSWSNEAQAADLVYFYAATAARAADSGLTLGGDGDCKHGPSSWGDLPTIVGDGNIKSGGQLKFVSYHDYTPDEAFDNIGNLASILSSNGYSGLPIFMTEWNYTFTNGTTDPHVVGNEATTYVGDQFIFFSQQPQMKGTALYTMLPNNVPANSFEDCTNCIITQGLYSVNGSSFTLANQMRTYRLMSVDLGLGAGTFNAFPATLSGLSSNDFALGYTNFARNVAAVIVNDASAATATVSLENIQASGCTFTVLVYYADTGSNTAISPAQTLTNQCINGGTMILSNLSLPAFSVTGIVIH